MHECKFSSNNESLLGEGVAKFLVPDWRVKSTLADQPARLLRQAERYDNIMPESTICSSLGL
jgi:hypothetical protein